MGISRTCTFGAQPMKAAQQLIVSKALKRSLYLIALSSRFLFGFLTGRIPLRYRGIVCLYALFKTLHLRFKFCRPVGFQFPRVNQT